MDAEIEELDAIVLPIAWALEEHDGLDPWELKDELGHLVEFGEPEEFEEVAARCGRYAIDLGWDEGQTAGLETAIRAGRARMAGRDD